MFGAVGMELVYLVCNKDVGFGGPRTEYSGLNCVPTEFITLKVLIPSVEESLSRRALSRLY